MAEQGDRASDWTTRGPRPTTGLWPPEIEGLEPHEVVGSGGSGTVWKCSQLRFHRWVAVKLVDTRLNKRAEALFARECGALGGLSGHPNIVPVYAGGLDGRGRPYLVMPFIETGSLADLLARQGPLDWRTATGLIVKVSGALQVAHEAGILHRDIKPDNVLMTRYGEPQLADFGVARIAGVVTTATNTITATPIHAAPEVLNGKPATERSDVYGLASSRYRLVSGTPAFYDEADESLLTLLVRIATQEPQPLTQFGIPAQLSQAVQRGMAKEPVDRTTSACEFAEALTDALSFTGDAHPENVETRDTVQAVAIMDGVVVRTGPEQSSLGSPMATDCAFPVDLAELCRRNATSRYLRAVGTLDRRPSGVLSTVASNVGCASGLAVDNHQTIYATGGSRTLLKIAADGARTTFRFGHELGGLAIDVAGNVYVSLLGGNSIVRLSPKGTQTDV